MYVCTRTKIDISFIRGIENESLDELEKNEEQKN